MKHLFFNFTYRFLLSSFYACTGLILLLSFSLSALGQDSNPQNPPQAKKKTSKKDKRKNNPNNSIDNAIIEEKDKQIEELTKKLEDQGIPVQANTKGIVLSGYVDASYTYNFINAPAFNKVPGFVPPPGYVGPTNTAGFAQGYPAIPGREPVDAIPGGGFNMNAFKLALEKPLTDENRWQAGFRADLIVGQDAVVGAPDAITGLGVPFSSWYSFNTSSFWLEQAYVIFRAPVGNGLDIKIGKFVDPAGYEVVERPVNLDFTYGLLFANLLPTTLTGMQAIYRWDDQWTSRFGIADGGFNVSRGGMEYFGYLNNMINNNDAYLLFLNSQWDAKGKNATLSATLMYGFNGVNPPGFGASPIDGVAQPYGIAQGIRGEGPFNQNNAFFLGDVWGSWAPKFAHDRLLLGFEFTGGFYNNNVTVVPAAVSGLPLDLSSGPSNWYGASVHMKYQITDIISIAQRMDWMESGWNSILAGHNAPTDIWAYTATMAFDLADNFMIRLEYRMDWGKGVLGYYGYPFQNPTGSPTALLGTSNGPVYFVGLEFVYSF
ncbi:outer membrane beta-barrel protein [Methylacidiphilum caldifontis]|uniref:outer membrane beta-barrel protein n=1 Tax=Methylacidiphilum caldifontis TaxID=2795386 RepID=UPI001F5CE16D|nr:outer membrane beta-barrel protein [Methylacidiphilum caldifontis]